jgi:formylglycine-generating enzyme required for sulfatase activity
MVIGATLRNRYKIIRLLGRGGFGDTYLAEDGDLPNNPLCVVKHFQPKSTKPAVLPIARRLFHSEAQVLYRLGKNHDQIPELFAHFEERGEFYLVQEFIDGDNLTKEIYAGHRLTEKQLKKLLTEILEVLAFVHQENIIHRDIKPQNIMRRRQDGKIVLIDFGAVREISGLTVNSQGISSLTVIVGSPGYMPSEQAAGQPKLSSDVCALGMLGIFALTGIRPHELPKDAATGEVIWRNWANISKEMANFLDKMVKYHFNDRYQSAGEALLALELINHPQQQLVLKPSITIPTAPLEKIPQSSRRHLLQTIGFMSAGFTLAIIGEHLISWKSKVTLDRIKMNNSHPRTATLDIVLKTFSFKLFFVDKKGEITDHKQKEAKYFREELGKDVILDLVQIPFGSFVMGSPNTEASREEIDESPQHQVTVPGFFMGKYEVTQAQYQAIMDNNPARFQFNGAKNPVEQVTWDDAKNFCHKLKQKTGRDYRLPSEAEWEYACRAGTKTPFYTGETITTELANYNGSDIYNIYAAEPKGQFRQGTTPVGTFRPNPFGLYDMSGNLSEWCQDRYHPNYQGAPTNGRSWETTFTEDYRIVRGGSWKDVPRYCRSASRAWYSPFFKISHIGFRVVLSSL